MKYFKKLSLIATFALAFLASSCAGITDANYNQPAETVTIEDRDMQDQSDIRDDNEEEPEMIRVKPD